MIAKNVNDIWEFLLGLAEPPSFQMDKELKMSDTSCSQYHIYIFEVFFGDVRRQMFSKRGFFLATSGAKFFQNLSPEKKNAFETALRAVLIN